MICHIYRSTRKSDAYLYLARKDDFECLPDTLLQAFGAPEYSMSFDLTPGRKLAQEDSKAVLLHLQADGYFLQLPRENHDPRSMEQQMIDSMQATRR